jgi:hypothetical protein
MLGTFHSRVGSNCHMIHRICLLPSARKLLVAAAAIAAVAGLLVVSIARAQLIPVQQPLSKFEVVPEGGGPLAAPEALRIVSVDPRTARPGDLITVSGNGLDKSSVSTLLLTDGARSIGTEVLEQSATEIRFKAPAQTEPGPWLEGEERPRRWIVVLQTADGNLLEYIAFKIGIE